MSEQKQFRAIRGTRDILPSDSSLWNWLERTARDVFESFNFREIRTPIFEQTDLFARAVGADTDIVGKEMFSFEDHPADFPDPRKNVLTSREFQILDDAVQKGVLPNSEAERTAVRNLGQLLARSDPSQM